MLRWRLLAAAAILIPLALLVWLDDQRNGGLPGIWLGPLALLVSLLACQETSNLLQKGAVATSPASNLLGVLLLLLATLVPVAWPADSPGCTGSNPWSNTTWTLIGTALALGTVFGAELRRFRQPGESLQRVCSGTFAVCYAGLLLSFLVQLRLWSPDRLGLVAVLSTVLIVKLADTGAYFVGKSLGRHKLTPRLSPGKTWEGAVGAVLSGLLAAAAVYAVILPRYCPDVERGALGWFGLYGLSLALAGMLGDLAESLLKRDAQCKDSSQWLPGLGGILDVLDSLLGAAPVSFAWWASGLLVAV